MRMMLRFTLPVEKSNAAINDGSLGRTMESILSKLKPEAAYFAPLDGKRAGMIFFNMAEPSQIIEAVEPLFLSLNATTGLVPVMRRFAQRTCESRRKIVAVVSLPSHLDLARRDSSCADTARPCRRGDRVRPAYAACRVGSVIELCGDTGAGASSGK